jgi:hypothetical protein
VPIEDQDPLRNNGLVARAWLGLEPLWLVYWVYYVALGAVFSFILDYVESHLHIYATVALLVPLLVYVIWVVVATWRCAANSSPLWMFLARLAIVSSVVLAVHEFWSALGST